MLVPVVGAIAAASLLASAGAGFAMQLGSDANVAVIPAGHVDPVRIEKRIQTKQASLEQRALTRLVNPANRQGLLRYLKEHTDIDLSRAVFQRGSQNYAGPDCPGLAWTCTQARHVVQISTRAADDDDDGGGNGANSFRCTGDPTPDLTCVVVQVSASGTNNAECVQRTDDLATVVMSCSITQTNTNGSNRARIEQDATHRSSGGVQDVLQTALLSQTTSNGNNRADVVQDVDLTMRGSADQMQDAHQRAEVEMFATVKGNNTAHVDQTEDLDAHQTSLDVQQLQNTDNDSVADCVTGSDPDEPHAPNSCAEIDMSTNKGNNNLDLDQENDLRMTIRGGGGDDDDDDDDGGSSSVSGDEQQGSCTDGDFGSCGQGDEPDGGTEAGIDLFSDDGNSTSHMTGSALQDMPDKAPLIDQLQFADPWCCFSTEFIGDSARAEIDLEVRQDGGDDTFQAGENGLGCIVVGGNCVAELEIRNEDGTFRAKGKAPILFANQQCTHFGESEPSFFQLQEGPQCSGDEVEFTTTTDTFTETVSGPG
jgi:hypothetical protein